MNIKINPENFISGVIVWEVANDDLNQVNVRDWFCKTRDFFKEHLFGFGLEHLDGDYLEVDYIPVTNDVFINKEEVQDVIIFWEVQWILYFTDYHIPEENRGPKIDPDPNEYYYSPPDPNAPSELEQIKRILGIY